MHLTGSDAHTPGQWALNKLKDFLVAQFALELYQPQFAAAGGVLVTANPVEALQWTRSKRALIFLSFDDGDHERSLWRVAAEIHPTITRGTKHSMVIVAELVTPPAGLPDVQTLRDAVGDMVDRNRDALRDLGLEQAKFYPDTARQQAGTHINPHDFSCNVYALNL